MSLHLNSAETQYTHPAPAPATTPTPRLSSPCITEPQNYIDAEVRFVLQLEVGQLSEGGGGAMGACAISTYWPDVSNHPPGTHLGDESEITHSFPTSISGAISSNCLVAFVSQIQKKNFRTQLLAQLIATLWLHY